MDKAIVLIIICFLGLNCGNTAPYHKTIVIEGYYNILIKDNTSTTCITGYVIDKQYGKRIPMLILRFLVRMILVL